MASCIKPSSRLPRDPRKASLDPVTPKSSLFLGGSCVAFIAAVGSVFELGSGVPKFGNFTTAIILFLSIPLGAYFFWAAVRDARANQ